MAPAGSRGAVWRRREPCRDGAIRGCGPQGGRRGPPPRQRFRSSHDEPAEEAGQTGKPDQGSGGQGGWSEEGGAVAIPPPGRAGRQRRLVSIPDRAASPARGGREGGALQGRAGRKAGWRLPRRREARALSDRGGHRRRPRHGGSRPAPARPARRLPRRARSKGRQRGAVRFIRRGGQLRPEDSERLARGGPSQGGERRAGPWASDVMRDVRRGAGEHGILPCSRDGRSRGGRWHDQLVRPAYVRTAPPCLAVIAADLSVPRD